jgi:hypothetical protein
MVRYKLKPPNEERQKAFEQELNIAIERSRKSRKGLDLLMIDEQIKASENMTPHKDERWKSVLLVFGIYFFLVWLCS